MLNAINQDWRKLYFVNLITLGLYGAFYVVMHARQLGTVISANLPSPLMGFLLTILSLGLYPPIILIILAYKLTNIRSPNLGHTVLALNLASLLTAITSAGFLLIISAAFWAQALFLVVKEKTKLNED